MIRTSCLCLLLATLLAVTSVGHAQIELRLEYQFGQEAIELLQGMTAYGYEFVDCPNDVNMPRFKADDPFFACWPTQSVQGRGVWMAFDRSEPNQPHNLMYIDSDCDGDLSDESTVVRLPIEENWITFNPARIVFPGENMPGPYHLNVIFDPYNGVFVGSYCCYAGVATIEGQNYQIIYKDNNHDGSFESLSIAPKGHPDFRSPGLFFDLNETLYSLEVLEHGALLKLTPAMDVAMGQVQVPQGISRVRFESELGTFNRVPKNGMVALPQGEHHLNRWTIERKDKQGRQWRAEGGRFGEQGLVEVAGGSIPSLKIGEPLLSSMTVNRNGLDLSFGQELTGHMSESITLYVDGERAEAPKLEVHDKTGKLVECLNFEYG